jgi:hypothetical protein
MQANETLKPGSTIVVTLLLAAAFGAGAEAQVPGWQTPHGQGGAKIGGSPNVEVLSHVPLGGFFRVTDIEMEQDPDRPYVYVSQTRDRAGFSIVDISNPEKAVVLFRWVIEDVELHEGLGGMDAKYFKTNGRYFFVQSTQFAQGGADSDLGAVVFDVTGLPDASRVREVGRIRAPETPGGFHNMFAYKHSSGRALLFTTVSAARANIYDLDLFLAGAPNDGKVGEVPVPQSNAGPGGYHDFYVGYDPATGQDKFYGAGAGGYHVYDVTNIDLPNLLFSMTAPGVTWGHTFTPTSDGKYAVTETEYQYAPLRIFDLQPGQRGEARVIRSPVGAWTADWKALSHNHEVRWPFVFVSGYEDGLQIFNMQDPTNPITMGWYYTYNGPTQQGYGGRSAPDFRGTSVMNGAFGIDVRNVDGLIGISDSDTGFWLFKMAGFQGWKGEDWAQPNISSVQDWDNGPVPRTAVIP